MALTTAFVNTCRSAVLAPLAELTAFRAALAVAQSGTRATRVAAWYATYSPGTDGLSPAYNLRRAVRDVVNAKADAAGTMSPSERELAYQQLVAEVVPDTSRPISDAEEATALETLIREDRLS